MSILRNRVRIEQTRHELDRLLAEINEWLARRNQADELHQYQTQLKVLGDALTAALGDLGKALKDVSSDEIGPVYRTCKLYDCRIIWVRRIWDYFRIKFDQRDDATLGPVLAAADEIVWSCYSSVFEKVKLNIPEATRRSPPLPYIEPLYSPKATPRIEPPSDLRSDVDPNFIKSFLNELPVPVVSLPPACVKAPWWLIYLGHEVGHHIQYDLLPKLELVGIFGEFLRGVVKGEPEPKGDDKVAQRWVNWGQEIFADAFSVFNMGHWAVWAMTELETADERTMLESKVRYPSSVARLALMSAVADQLGLDGQGVLRDLNARKIVIGPPLLDNESRDLRQIAAQDMKLVSKIAAAVAGQSLARVGPMREWCDWRVNDFREGGDVYHWKEGFRDREPLVPEPNLRAARLVISGAIAAWAEVSNLDDSGKRADAQAKLAESVLSMATQSREEGTREAAAPFDRETEQFGEKLARLLLDASAEALGAST